MASKETAKNKRVSRNRKKPMDFSKRLGLNQYLLSIFGCETLEELAEPPRCTFPR